MPHALLCSATSEAGATWGSAERSVMDVSTASGTEDADGDDDDCEDDLWDDDDGVAGHGSFWESLAGSAAEPGEQSDDDGEVREATHGSDERGSATSEPD